MSFYFHFFFFTYFHILIFYCFHTWSHTLSNFISFCCLFIKLITLLFNQIFLTKILITRSLNKTSTFLFQVSNFLTGFNKFFRFLIQASIQGSLEILASFMIVFHFCCRIINKRLFRVRSFITNWVILWKFIDNILISSCKYF